MLGSTVCGNFLTLAKHASEADIRSIPYAGDAVWRDVKLMRTALIDKELRRARKKFDQMDAAVTIQAQVRGFVERKRGIIMESRKSQEELNVPKEFLEETVEEEKIAKGAKVYLILLMKFYLVHDR